MGELDAASSSASERPVQPETPRVHTRRPRYSGKNPRHFAEKYKELQPERYADEVAKILASGKTPAGSHRPILVREILEALDPQPGQVVVDCTLGFGGHARELLARIAPESVEPRGRLIALDVDPVEQPKTIARLRGAGWGDEVLTPVRRNFAGLAQVLGELGVIRADAILADLGVSSMQLDDPGRGFTFKADGPLDLRLNPQRAPSAAEWLARVTVRDLERALVDFADEPQAGRLAVGLKEWQEREPFTRTRQLALAIPAILDESRGRPGSTTRDDTVRRVFQALRIAVNDEMGVLDALLRQLPDCLKPGGRVAILTFHSGEDRRVKHAFREGQRAGIYSVVSETVTRPSAEEVRANPRSSSAKLRWAVRADFEA